MNYKLCFIRSIKLYQNTKKIAFTFNSNSFPCFLVFPLFWKCCKRWDFTAEMVWWYCAVAHFWGSIGCKKCPLLAAMLLFRSCFFTHSINQGWANLFNGRDICKNKEHQQPVKPVCSVSVSNIYTTGRQPFLCREPKTNSARYGGPTNLPQTIPFP